MLDLRRAPNDVLSEEDGSDRAGGKEGQRALFPGGEIARQDIGSRIKSNGPRGLASSEEAAPAAAEASNLNCSNACQARCYERHLTKMKNAEGEPWQHEH